MIKRTKLPYTNSLTLLKFRKISYVIVVYRYVKKIVKLLSARKIKF